MSIGSETNGGASAIRVLDLSIDGADNGIRIKSNSTRGGFVHDIVYEDVCIRKYQKSYLYGHALHGDRRSGAGTNTGFPGHHAA